VVVTSNTYCIHTDNKIYAAKLNSCEAISLNSGSYYIFKIPGHETNNIFEYMETFTEEDLHTEDIHNIFVVYKANSNGEVSQIFNPNGYIYKRFLDSEKRIIIECNPYGHCDIDIMTPEDLSKSFFSLL